MSSPESHGEADSFLGSKVGEQFPPSLVCQNWWCPLLAGPRTGPGEQIGTGSLPVTCSGLLGEADLAGGCRTGPMLLGPGLHPPACRQLWALCPSPSTQHLAGMSSAHPCFLLKGSSRPGEARFGPIALLWLPERGYGNPWLAFAGVVPARNFPTTSKHRAGPPGAGAQGKAEHQSGDGGVSERDAGAPLL